MLRVNLFGENKHCFSNIFTDFVYTDTDCDLDVFVTQAFHHEPCMLIDLKTDNLIIFNLDVCHSLRYDLFPAVNKFLQNTNIQCLVTTSHFLTEEIDERFDYLYYSQTTHDLNENIPTKDLPILFSRDVSYLRQRKYLTLNSVVKSHRTGLYEFLRDNDHLNDGWVSYNSQALQGCLPEGEHVILDNVDDVKEQQNRGMADWNFGLYLSSYFSIVTETEFNYADGEDIPSVNFSEKTFKAMLGMHPFFVLSQPKALWSLQQLGFKTFSDYWNEDYDLIQDDDWRLQSCLESIGDFLNNDMQNMHKILSGVDFDYTIGEILNHNFKHFTNHTKIQTNLLRSKIHEFVDG